MQRPDTTRHHKRIRTNLLESVIFGAESDVNKDHFQACESCAIEAKELSSLLKLLDEWQAPEPSPYFDTRLRARLRAESEDSKPLWEVVRSLGLGWRFALASLLAGFLIVFGFFSAGPTRPVSTTFASGPSAVADLQILDRDADLLSELNSLDDGSPDSE